MKYASLFAGIGGFDLALTRLGHQNVYANEWDKYASSIFIRHFGQCDTRDIREVATADIPDHDLLVGGFPCQAFSVAGKRGGFDDTRGTLFFEIARILKDKRPRYFILENVKGLLSHDSGKTFSTILEVLTSIGYECQWSVVNSKDHGVPQSRERVFFVGHLRGASRPEIFPLRKRFRTSTEASGKEMGQVALTLRAAYSSSNAKGSYVITGYQKDRIQKYPVVSSHFDTGGDNVPQVYGVVIQDIRGIKKSQNGKGYKEADTSYTVDTFSTQGISNGKRIRRLTPKECERLQGFPDGWTEGVSDTQRYKMLGNAVTVNVVEAIARNFSNYITDTV